MFHIIVFKNNKKKKKLKSFVRENLAIDYFNKLVKKSNDIIFTKKFESGYECKFDIAIITDKFIEDKIYYTDEYGRNKIIDSKIDDLNYIYKISQYNFEEDIFDVQQNKRITLPEFEKMYLNKDKIYMVSKLKNKFILQDDDNFKLFSLKNEDDADRLLNLFMEIKLGAKLIVVKDVSSPQRKYLYEMLVGRGYNKKFLYTSYTTYPK
jgi:hypothetical protein